MVLNPFTNTPARIAVIGLGYVGLPLAIAFAAENEVIGFDISAQRVSELASGSDKTLEVSSDALKGAARLSFTTEPAALANCNVFVVTVPTPIDNHKRPDLSALMAASHTVGAAIDQGGVVIYESTVYPGATEEVCIPILEKQSGLKWKEDFHVGFSPERINPGDKEHTLTTILKVVSGDDEESLERIAQLYESVVTAGVYRASSIKVAEAAKVIENTQRDLNIALMNELAIIFDKIGIDTLEVLKAAGTKWNFLPFRPGLVGGHCIGVDPYYLTHKAEMVGYHPQVILAGRRINDGMAKFVAEKTVKSMISSGFQVKGAKVNVIGLTFKENCPDLRNSKVADIVHELESYGVDVHVYDPLAESAEAEHEYGIKLESWDSLPKADALIAAVPHKEVLALSLTDFQSKLNDGGCFIDVKSQFDPEALREAGYCVWRL
jgi:UDP-N-acetyl-D-glucosamine/UDP-N-acetyl-D-galactosamine dehydrogenase